MPYYSEKRPARRRSTDHAAAAPGAHAGAAKKPQASAKSRLATALKKITRGRKVRQAGTP